MRHVGLCDAKNLYIHVGNTKEMVVDFKRRAHTPHSFFITGEAELVTIVKYLDLQISTNLTRAINTDSIIKKAHQWLLFIT